MFARPTFFGLVLVVALGGVSLASAHLADPNGDHNGDGTIDLADFAEFPNCMAAPGGGLSTGCGVFDFDTDADVDVLDFAEFQRAFGTTFGVVVETVTVGNPGNAGELSGAGAGGFGSDRICGAVDYVYNIGKFEVTAGQYTDFLNAVAATEDWYGLYSRFMWEDPRGCKIQRHELWGGSYLYRYNVPPGWEDRPVNFVSWGDAARFANWLHNGQPRGVQDLSTTEDGSYYLNGATSEAELLAVDREPDATWVIPSEDEWYKAAYHKNDGVTGNYFDYPTSSDSVPSNDLINPDPGNNANFYNSGYTIGSPFYRTEVGEFENSYSPYGTFDQGGNVWEWNEAIPFGSSRGVRGGAAFDLNGLLPPSYRNGAGLSTISYDLGFRVSEVP